MTAPADAIEVAVNAPVFGRFTYRVPEALRDRIRIGVRVLIPFGPRELTGYVLGIVPPPEQMRMREIRDVLDEVPLFPESLLPFYLKMADYYRHPEGETLAAALPSGINKSDETLFGITESGNRHVAEGGKDADLLERLVAGPLPAARIRDAGKTVPRSRLDRLVKEGLLEKTKRMRRQSARIKQEKHVAADEKAALPLPLSPKRQEVWGYLVKHGPVDATILRKTIKGAGAALKWFQEKHALIETDVRVFRDPLGDAVEPDVAPPLMPEQADVVREITSAMEGGFHRFLLHGVTGSGKTEVYLRLVETALEANKTAIVLVPEIALISQTERRFRARFGEKVAVLHSGLSHGERLDQWETIRSGEKPVVIGARSAIFAPLGNVGVLVVDEEHDSSYKQDTGLRYNGRDMAVLRAQMEDCTVVLGSATPSMESWQNAVAGKFKKLSITQRANNHPLPSVRVVDLRDQNNATGLDRFFSKPLQFAMQDALNRGEQTILFLNKRGYAGFPVCKICGEPLKCRHCDITLTLHKKQNGYRCHFCGFSVAATTPCPSCGAPELQVMGMGTEKVEAAARFLFPDARIARMDQDTTSKKGSLVKMLRDLKHGEIDILVGTQMVAKGHDFPNITVVGVMNADIGLAIPDFRSGERTFQLLAQVAGRAGRGDKPGQVILQTMNPDHYAITSACTQQTARFVQEESGFRKMLGYPPFARMIQVRVSGKNEAAVIQAAGLAGQRARNASGGRIQILGPTEAPIAKLSDHFRHHMLLMCPHVGILRQAADAAASVRESESGIHVVVDVDPYFMM